MKTESIVGGLIGVCGAALFTCLLSKETISELTYVMLLGGTAVVSLVTHGFSRLKELDLKNLKLTLNEIKEAQKQLEHTKADIVEMYGGIENLRRAPMVLDTAKINELGLGEGVAFSSAVMRYSVGCIKRERERLAQIFVNEKQPEEIAKAILDTSLDDNVFKWNGPESPLADPPKSLQKRKEQAEQSKPSDT